MSSGARQVTRYVTRCPVMRRCPYAEARCQPEYRIWIEEQEEALNMGDLPVRCLETISNASRCPLNLKKHGEYKSLCNFNGVISLGLMPELYFLKLSSCA